MKKKIMIGALAALFLSVGIFAATNLTEEEQVSGLTLANIEAMTMWDIDADSSCLNGGTGASGCNNSGEVAGVGYSCGVSCQEGYYACCTLTCKCKPNK